MKISIALATFNGARYLAAQLESFSAQRRLPDELIVSDDCSSDETIEILQEYQKSAPFEVHIHQNSKNLGFIENFGKALSMCSGDIIFLSDQDDVWMAHKISRVCQLFEEGEDIQVITNNHIITDEELNPSGFTTLGNVRKMGRGDQSFMHGCCTSLRGKFRDLVVPMAEGISHDGWIGKLGDALGVRVVVDEVLQYYRKHESNASLWYTSRPEVRGRFDDIRKYGLADARGGWSREIEVLRQMRSRLIEGGTTLKNIGVPEEKTAEAIGAIESRISRLLERTGIVSMPRLARVVGIARFAYSGGYREFKGWASALKDVLR
jgi:glycosyltransferase involved in cell wall biosynthesis